MIFVSVEAHVNRLGSILIDGIVGETFCSLIVDVEGGGRLWLSMFTDSGADRDGLLAINEGGADFGFGG